MSLILIASISLLFICIGDVNFLAPIVTMPFLVTYIAVDYAYFALAMTADLKSINRPESSSSLSHSGSSRNNSSKAYGSIKKFEDDTHSEADPVQDKLVYV